MNAPAKTGPTKAAAKVNESDEPIKVPGADSTPQADPPAPEQRISMTPAELDAFVNQAITRWAKNNPTAGRSAGERDAISTKPDTVLDIPVDGRLADLARPDLVIEKGEDNIFEGDSAKFRELAFMEEMIDITITESTNPNDQALVPLAVNGRTVWILRGEKTRIKRYYVDLLGRARKETVVVKAARDANGDIVNRTVKTSGLSYPFQVVHDPNPRGKAWLAKLMREGR